MKLLLPLLLHPRTSLAGLGIIVAVIADIAHGKPIDALTLKEAFTALIELAVGFGFIVSADAHNTPV
jgi:hypothetical protein